jgi:hypothetical protein
MSLWEGLKFNGGSTDVFIARYTEIIYARHGVTINSTGKVLIENSEISSNALNGIYIVDQVDVQVKNNILQSNGNGVAAIGNVTSGIEVTHNAFYDNENGIYIHATGGSCQIHDVIISGNEISRLERILRFRRIGSGIRFLCNASSLDEEAQIFNVAVLDNVVAMNLYGINFRASGLARIFDSVISNNNVSLNSVGIRVLCEGNISSWVSNFTVSDNKVFSNGKGISLEAPSISPLPYDCLVRRNIISANNLTGVEALNRITVNLTENSVAYNSYGVVAGSEGNLARKNDIYGNTIFGVYVNGSGSIDAIDNYWGNSSGPCHEYFNPTSQGDKVNGNGADLRFSPFLPNPSGIFPINEPPVAKLSVALTGTTKQNLVFDALESYDDTRISNYYFDFGDGNATWWASGTIEYAYSTPGTYHASLIVLDELGVRSRNTVDETIHIAFPPLIVYVVMKPTVVASGGTASVAVHVTNGSYAIEGASVNITSDKGGWFEADSGLTDAGGDFVVNYTSPKVSTDTVITIIVKAFKGGFTNGSEQVLFPVVMPSSNQFGLNSPLFWGAVIAAGTVVVIAVVLLRRRRSRNRRIAKIRSRKS